MTATDTPQRKRINEQQRRLPVGVRLRAYRDERGLSHRDLSTYTQRVDPLGVGLHATTISRIETDKQNARAETVKMLADALTLALGRSITPNDLYAAYGGDSLSDLLEAQRMRQAKLRSEWARLLNIPLERYNALADKRAKWQPNDLPGVVRVCPMAHPMVMSVLAEHSAGA